MSKKLSMRTAERLIRNAYDLADLATRLRYDGHERWADKVLELSSSLGKVGRAMSHEIDVT